MQNYSEAEQQKMLAELTPGYVKAIQESLDDVIGKGEAGCALLTFTFGDAPRFTNYASSADRRHMIAALRELADRLESSGIEH